MESDFLKFWTKVSRNVTDVTESVSWTIWHNESLLDRKLLAPLLSERFVLMTFDFLLVQGFQLLTLYSEFSLALEILAIDPDLIWIKSLLRLFSDLEFIVILSCWLWTLSVTANWTLYLDPKVTFLEKNWLLTNHPDKPLAWYLYSKIGKYRCYYFVNTLEAWFGQKHIALNW